MKQPYTRQNATHCGSGAKFKLEEVSIIHQNVQSLGNAVDKINDLLNDHIECKFLCITEHWKSSEQLKSLSLKNFKLSASYCRDPGQHGGSAIYVHKSIKNVRQRNKINKLSSKSEFECAAIECDLNGFQIIMVSVYRPPTGNVTKFLDILEKLLISIISENKNILIAGDFNIDILKESGNRTDFLSVMQSFDLRQTIFTNTRVVHKSASCIDNIFVNFNYVNSNVLNTYISDHAAQKLKFHVEQTNKTLIYRRIFSDENKLSFLNILKEQDWLQIYEVERNNINRQWNKFMDNFTKIFNHCFPLKLIDTKQNKKYKIKVNPQIEECKNKLDLFLTLSRHDNRHKESYKKVKIEYDNLLKAARSEIYEKQLNLADNKTKCMWNICKDITGQTDKNSDIGIKGNAREIPGQYNTYLLSIIPELLKEIERIKPLQFSSTIKENDQSLFLRPISLSELCDIAKKIKNKHSSGVDNIPTSIVKTAIPIIKDVLCYIINNSFKQGIFPEQLKIALVKPIFKKGDPEKMENYRPISLLPAFSKVFELIMCHRLIEFMKKCNLIITSQHGYTHGKSTQTAIFQFTKKF